MATRTWVIPVIMILCGRTLISSRGGTGVLGHEVDNYLWRYKVSNEMRCCAHVPSHRDVFMWGTCMRCDNGGGFCIN